MTAEQRKQLFDYFYSEHGVMLLESDIDEVYRIVIGMEEYLKRANEIMKIK